MSTEEFAIETMDTTWNEIEISTHLLAEVKMGFEELRRGEGVIVTHETEFLNLARAN
jgi:hypothetical protein